MDIRPIRHDDPDEMAAAGAVVRAGYFALADYPHDEEYDVVIGAVADRAHESEVVVAVDDDGTVLACLTYVAHHEAPHAEHGDEGAATFRYFAVSPDAQGRGVGEAMVRWVVGRALADGKERIRIHTIPVMTAAMRLYDRLGFERDPSQDEDWDGVVGLGYVLGLRPAD